MFNKMGKSICRLCLNLAENESEAIDQITRQMLEVLLSQLDLSATINPILCKDCARMTEELFNFKSACVETEELVFTFSLAKERADFDIREVYEENKNVIVTHKGFKVCRFCMNQTNKNKSIPLDVLMNDVTYVETLPILMPKTVLNIGRDPVICTPCRVTFERYVNFVRNCLDIEEKINKFRQSQERNSTNPIELSNVLRFLSKDRLGYPDEGAEVTVIKRESLWEDKKEDIRSQMDLQIKSEAPLDIKDEMTTNENAPVEKYKCPICPYETKCKKINLTRHMLIHKDPSKVEMHKCETCVYETKYKRNLQTHMLVHIDTAHLEKYKCTLCPYETIRRKHLKRHVLIHKGPSEVEMHKCDICGYEAKLKHYVTQHMVTHRVTWDIGKYKCTICSYKTKVERYLERHVRRCHKNSS